MSLWTQPIEIIGVTGEIGSGKTLFALSVAPGSATKVYDAEKSSASYTSLNFDRLDIPAEMLKRFPKGYKPIDTFEWWLADVRSTPKGKYQVIVQDPVSEIESGLADWVIKHPGEFGRTAAQYQRMQGLMWGDVKEYWKTILSDIAARCETFVFTSHMGQVWSGDKPVPGKRKPKGKETLNELASLYLMMERKPDDKGNVPDVPSARVLKSRLATTKVVNGEVVVIPTLPPRMPKATPGAIRQYMLKPPDYARLQKEELAPEERISSDELAQMRLATAEAERDVELARLEHAKLGGHVPQDTVAVSEASASPFSGTTASVGQSPQQAPVPPSMPAPASIPTAPIPPTDTGRINDEQSKIIAKLIQEKGIDVKELCNRYQVRSYSQLPAIHFEDACFWMRTRVGFSSAGHELDYRIDELVIALKIDRNAWANRLVQLYQCNDAAKLTPEQKKDLLGRLENTLAAQKEAAQKTQPQLAGTR